MNKYMVILVLVSTTAGLVWGIIARARLLSQIPSVFRKVISGLSSDLFSIPDIGSQVFKKVDPLQLLPFIEEHIDDFLRHRLGKAMPVIGMFIGDKTIAELKRVFMNELVEILPVVMEKYAEEVMSRIHLHEMVTKKWEEIPPANLVVAIKTSLHPELMIIPLYSAAAGLITGLLQCLILWLLA